MADRARTADHLDAGTYLTDEVRLMYVLADTRDGVEVEDACSDAIVCLTLRSVANDWRVVTPAESADA